MDPAQLWLVDPALVRLDVVDIGQANELLVRWGHRLGPVHRPFRQEAYALAVDRRIVAVATSGSAHGARVAGYERTELVELTRLCADPEHRWATRVMLRLWREVCARRWACWPVRAAVSYSHNAHHRGDVYRFDGWTKVRDDAGGRGVKDHGRERPAVYEGAKTLWLWRYE
jgi:hypothetical protein